MSKLVLLFSCDPGGSNTVIPLFYPLRQKGYRVKLFGKGTALKRYKLFSLRGLNTANYFTDVKLKNVESFLEKERPDFIITGTSAEDLTERFLWKAAERLKIPSFAILDHWFNYGIRFSQYKASQLEEYNANKLHSFLPTKVLVMDNYAKDEMVRIGFNESRILVTGQPYFEFLTKWRNHRETIKKTRKNLKIARSDFVITYASEPLRNKYLRKAETNILITLYQSLKKISLLSNKKITLVIKIHPREDKNKYLNIINNFKKSNINIIVNKDFPSYGLILASNLICGIFSMFLIEALLLNRPVISIKIGLEQEELFVLVKKKVIKNIRNKKTLFKELKEIIVQNKPRYCNFAIIKSPIKNVINAMERHI